MGVVPAAAAGQQSGVEEAQTQEEPEAPEEPQAQQMALTPMDVEVRFPKVTQTNVIEWSLEKVATPSKATVEPGGTVTVDYALQVDATPTGLVDVHFGGELAFTNKGTEPATVTIEGGEYGDVGCAIDPEPEWELEVGPGLTRDVGFSGYCSDQAPLSGEVPFRVEYTWNDEHAEVSGVTTQITTHDPLWPQLAFLEDSAPEFDAKYPREGDAEPPWNLNSMRLHHLGSSEPSLWEYEVKVTAPTTPGECVTHTNEARISSPPPTALPHTLTASPASLPELPGAWLLLNETSVSVEVCGAAAEPEPEPGSKPKPETKPEKGELPKTGVAGGLVLLGATLTAGGAGLIATGRRGQDY